MSFAAPMGSQFDSQHSRRNAGSFHVGVVSFRPFDRLHVGLASCVYGERAATTKPSRHLAMFVALPKNEQGRRSRRVALAGPRPEPLFHAMVSHPAFSSESADCSARG